MNRLPNPWVIIPVAVAVIAGGLVGYLVTNASCAPDTCAAAAIAVGAAVGLGAAVGVGVVVVLALKSLSEWTEHTNREILTATDPDQPPTPPTC
jgi:hypothetical protein